MKRIYTILIASVILLAAGQAQSEADALRYSQNFYGGTARALSMGGAFGALGGDFTSASLNPAGIGVYRSTELTFTPNLLYDNTSSNYLGKTTEDNKYQFMVNNLGFVHTNLTGKEEGWIGVTFGLGYNQLNSFNRNTSMKGVMLSGSDNSSSLLDNFTNWANDTPGADQDQSLLDPFYEGLAWETWMLNLDSLGFWNELWNQYYGQSQRRRIVESGGIGEYAISVGANYGNRLYIGGTFGIHRLRYTSEVNHREFDDAGIINDFNSFSFRELLDTRGTGYTIKVGMIFRPISLIRIGAAFHLPTFYNMKESFYTDMQSIFDNGDEYYLDSPTNEFDYWLRTPWKAIGSVAVQLGRVAIISADYEYMDYRKMNMDSRNTDDDLLDQNDRIQEIYSAAHNIRAGAELHLGPMYLRGGASYYDSPFRKTEANGDSYSITLNGGLGFRSNNVFFDLAYAHRLNEYKYWLYVPEDVNGANISTNNNQIAATLGFRF
ncbi:OmpP1/FadL family transporter [Bacteroidota bacterium]